MSETPVVVENQEVAVENPSVETPVVVELPEQRYEWQPTDEDGHPIGNKQVIKFRTDQEKFDKMIEQNTLILRKLREQTRKIRLGIPDDDTISEEVPTIPKGKTLSSRKLTADEKYQMARDMQDPDKIEDALDRWAQARYGVAPEDQVDAFNTLQNQMTEAEIEREAITFINSTPEYYGCATNFNILAGWMAKHNLQAKAENWKLAFEKNKDIMLGPSSTPITPPVVAGREPFIDGPTPVEAPVVVPPVEEPQEFQRITTALTRDNTSDVGTVRTVGSDIVYVIAGRTTSDKHGNKVKISPDRTVYGQEAIDVMPGDEYKHRLLHEPGFRKKVEELNRKAEEKAAAQRNG